MYGGSPFYAELKFSETEFSIIINEHGFGVKLQSGSAFLDRNNEAAA